MSASDLEILFHEFGMFNVWNILFNVMVAQAQFRYYKKTALIHTIFGLIITAGTFAFTLVLLIPNKGFDYTIEYSGYIQYIHSLVGLIFFGLVFVQVAIGFWGRLCQWSLTASPKLVQVTTKTHMVIGYVMGYAIKVSILIQSFGYPFFYPALGVQIAFLILFLALKLYVPKVEWVAVYQPMLKENYAEIKDIQEIKSFRNKVEKYFIVSDYVFDMAPLQQFHPGGARILQPLQGRQMDRFIYGMYSSEFHPQVGSHSHSRSFLDLIPRPIAKLVYPNPYTDVWPEVSQILQVLIKFYECPNKDENIFMLGMSPKTNEMFVFRGYSSLKQIGQYYSLTLNKTYTRLYTSVNCLNRKNIAFNKQFFTIRQIIRRETQNRRPEMTQMKQVSMNQGMLNKQHFLNPEEMNNYLPILLKIYDKGKLTKQLRVKQFTNCHLQLSVPRGKGLELDKTPPGHILIVCGGTGLFPFMDFIDLKFKAALIKQKPELTEQILFNDSVLANHDFSKWGVTILLAVNDMSDIHPLTLQQLSYLSNFKKELRCVIKSKTSPGTQQNFKNFQYTKDRFDARVQSQLQSGDIVKVWLCGPPVMNQSVVKRLQTVLNFDMHNLLIV